MDSTSLQEELASQEENQYNKSTQTDYVEDKYQILLSKGEITELSNEFCKYYPASLEDNDNYFAIVFEKFHLRSDTEITFFTTTPHSFLNNPVAYSITYISQLQEERLVVVVPSYDPASNLESLLNSGYYDNSNLIYGIIKPISELIISCTGKGITLGNIHPKNIMHMGGGQFKLREYFHEPPNYSQETGYLATELCECYEVARVPFDETADLFALGVLALHLTLEKAPWRKHGFEQLKELRFHHTSFTILSNRLRLPESLKWAIKGLLRDNPYERWRIRNIYDWMGGKYEKASGGVIAPASNPIIFNETSYDNLKHLAYAMGKNWEIANSFVAEDKLVKWLQRNVSDESIYDRIYSIFYDEANSTIIPSASRDKDTKLFLILNALDSTGPIRTRGMAFTFNSIPQLLLYSLVKNKKDIFSKVLNIITKNLWLDKYEDVPSTEYTSWLYNCFNMITELYDPNSLGFGIERLCYLLNPHIPCLSPKVSTYFNTKVAELLRSLDIVSAENPNINLDKHIIAFIANKINLNHDVELKMLKKYPSIANNKVVNSLAILVLAEQSTEELELTNIGQNLAKKLEDVVDRNIHNVETKKRVNKKIADYAKEGDISEMLNVISDVKMLDKDNRGFEFAKKEVNAINSRIANLLDYDKVEEIGHIFGLRLTVLIAYFLCLTVTVILLAGY
jgi:hypothetical protein